MKIGILGNGQLGRMLALAGRHLNIGFAFYDHNPSKTTEGLGVFFNDITEFLQAVDIVTYENENISLELATLVKNWPKPLYPGFASLEQCQHRLKEKALFNHLKIPTVEYRAISTKETLLAAADDLSFPLVLKTLTQGYDGKGQTILQNTEDLHAFWLNNNAQHLSADPLYIAEQFIPFSHELSMIAVRDQWKNIVFYPVVENHHRQGILHKSLVPARISPTLELEAKEYISRLLQALDHIGVFTLELFATANGLLANECAPRVHNSGHWTIEGCECSQFENHIRAIAGLPLGSPHFQDHNAHHIAMLNLLGEIQDDLHPAISELPNIYLHDYLKEPRPQRKLGHITVLSPNDKDLIKNLEKIATFLGS